MRVIICTLLITIAFCSTGQAPELMLPVGHTKTINQAVFSSDGKLLATASGDRSAMIWELSTERLLHTLTGHTDEVDLVAFNSSTTRIITGSRDNTARVWDLLSGKLLYTFAHSALVSTVAFSPDGKYIMTSSWISGRGQPGD